MSNGNYAKGANRERQFIKRLYAEGALWATRSAGSHSMIDVAATFPNGTRLYQLKCGNSTISPVDRKGLEYLATMCEPHTSVWSVTWKDRQEPVIQRV